MNLNNFIKKFDLPPNFVPPIELHYEDLVARPLGRTDLEDDLAGVNSSVEIIQKTRGGSWPSEKLDKDSDLLDLAWHECEFRDRNSFAYVVYTAGGVYVGCFYLYPLGVRTVLDEEKLAYDADASWWVTTDAYERGYYGVVFSALKQWLAEDFRFKNPYYSNKEIPE